MKEISAPLNITIIVFFAITDPFIKVVLLFDGKKVKKKKTSTRKQETNPVYNECMIFDVPPDLLHRVLFVISVADAKPDSTRSDVIGRVVIGSATTGESLKHWHQMLISPRRPVAAWHRLKMWQHRNQGCFPLLELMRLRGNKMEQHFSIKPDKPRGMTLIIFYSFPEFPTWVKSTEEKKAKWIALSK